MKKLLIHPKKTKIFLFSPNTAKYGPEKTRYLETFHTVALINALKLSSPDYLPKVSITYGMAL